MSKIQRRTAKLIKDLKVIKSEGLEIFYPIGTTFYNYRPNKNADWDVWFYEYKMGNLGLLLAPEEYEIVA